MQTTINGPAKPADDLYLRTDISPEELFQAIGRLRKEAQDEIDRLLAFLDSLDDCDEDSAIDDAGCDEDSDTEQDRSDEEPSLGSPIASFTQGQEMWSAGDASDFEQEHDGREPEDEHGDNADMEPSLGWPAAYGIGGAGLGGFDDREEVRR